MTKARGKMTKPPSLIVDGMLGSLARKLRLYGFDTLYYNDKEDRELITIAEQESRILITSDEMLVSSAKARGLQAINVRGRDDLHRLVEVFRFIGYHTYLKPEKSRCPLCNGILFEISKDRLNDKLPDSLLKRYPKFFSCEKCGKIYWEGGHWRRLSAFDAELNKALEASSYD